MANPNFQLLVDAAKLLKAILGELVFVGGCTTALLITDNIAWRTWVPGCTSGTSSAGLGRSRADNHCRGETERNRLTLSYCVGPARATKLRFRVDTHPLRAMRTDQKETIAQLEKHIRTLVP